MYAELANDDELRSPSTSSWTMPMPTETSAGGCSSHLRAKLGMIHETLGSVCCFRSWKNSCLGRCARWSLANLFQKTQTLWVLPKGTLSMPTQKTVHDIVAASSGRCLLGKLYTVWPP